MNHESIELNLRRRTPYFNLRDQMNEKKKIKKKLLQFNKFLNSYGLEFKKIDIAQVNQAAGEFQLYIKQDVPTADAAAICQNARDVSLMSERSYVKFRQTISPIAHLPTLRKCNAYKKQMNQVWPLNTDESDQVNPDDIYSPNESNKMGASIAEPLKKIKFVCEKYLAKKRTQNPANDFRIMLCGDGVQITKTHLSLANFCFTLMNDGDLSHKGFYTLGKY